MHEDRLRWLVGTDKWGLPEASELVKAAPSILSQIEKDRTALKAAEYLIAQLKSAYAARPVRDLDEAEVAYRIALSAARFAGSIH